MYFALRTDSPTAHLALINQDGSIRNEQHWLAERRLAQELLARIGTMLEEADMNFADLKGLLVFRGPGSFTGLRIGITIMNTMADSLNIPIIGVADDDWISKGFFDLQSGSNDRLVLPEYGAEARITKPKK